MASLDPSLIARLEGWRFSPRFMQAAIRIGQRLSRRVKGTSSEFVDYRNYAPGEDPRRIDWKAYARSDRYYLRSHEGETNCVIQILLDASRSMDYKSRPDLPTKWEAACQTAMGFSYLAAKNNDISGLTLFADQPLASFPPRGGWQAFYETAALLDAFKKFVPRTGYKESFHKAQESMAKRGLVFVLSDFLGNAEEAAAALEALEAARHEVAAVRLLDPAETELRFSGISAEALKLVNVENEPAAEAEIQPDEIRALYIQKFNEEEEKLQMLLAKQGIPFIRIRTDEDLGASLIRALNSKRLIAKAS